MPRQPNPQNRLACDRCHAQKLRCARQEGQGGCVRCLRANATCVFSPRQRRTVSSKDVSRQPNRKPAPRAAAQTEDFDMELIDSNLLFSGGHPDPPSNTEPVPMDVTAPPAELCLDSQFNADTVIDWSNFLSFRTPSPVPGPAWDLPTGLSNIRSPSPDFWGMTLPGPGASNNLNPGLQEGNNKTAETPSSTESADSDTPLPLVDYIRQLADLNVRLYEHFNALPSLRRSVPGQYMPTTTDDGPMVAIDEIFRMTQSLIDIMIRFYPPAGVSTHLVPDKATLMLLLSCTDRVFDIYELFFTHMRGCIVERRTPVTEDGRPFTVPQLRIGSYAPPQPAALTMHMLIVVMMASHLFDQLQDLLGVWRQSNIDKNTTMGDVDSRDGSTVVRANHEYAEVQLAVGKRSRFPDFTEEAQATIANRARTVAGHIVNARLMVLNMPGMNGSGTFTDFMAAARGDHRPSEPGKGWNIRVVQDTG